MTVPAKLNCLQYVTPWEGDHFPSFLTQHLSTLMSGGWSLPWNFSMSLTHYALLSQITTWSSICDSSSQRLQRGSGQHLPGIQHLLSGLSVFLHQVLTTAYTHIRTTAAVLCGLLHQCQETSDMFSAQLPIFSMHPSYWLWHFNPLIGTTCLCKAMNDIHLYQEGPAKWKLAFMYLLLVFTCPLYPSDYLSHTTLLTAFMVSHFVLLHCSGFTLSKQAIFDPDKCCFSCLSEENTYVSLYTYLLLCVNNDSMYTKCTWLYIQR